MGGLLDNIQLYRRPVEFIDGVDGKYDVTVQVDTPDGRSDTESFQICIVKGMVDHSPELQQIAEQSIDEEQAFSLIATATDSDLPDDTLTYSLISGPEGLQIDAATGEISWTPTEAQGPGQYEVTVRVTDETDLFDEATFNILVGEVGTPPVLEPIADQNIDEQQTLSLTGLATDSDLPTEALIYTIESGPDGLQIDSATGEISWTPTEAQGPGQYDVTVRATDETDLFDEATFNIFVGEVGTPPVLEPIANRSITTDQSLEVQPLVSDSDLPAEELTFALLDAPEGITIDSETGLINWDADEQKEAGEFVVEVQVTDSTGLFDRETFFSKRFGVESGSIAL